MDALSRAERNQLASNLRALEQHPGWRYLAQHIEEREQVEIAKVARGGLSVEQYGRASGVLYALRDLTKLPAALAETLTPPEEEA